MSVLTTKASKDCRELILSALGQAVAAGELPAEPIPDFSVEQSDGLSHGDWTSNAALVSAKAFRLSPRKIAEILSAHMNETLRAGEYNLPPHGQRYAVNGQLVQRVEFAGPGFLNFFLGAGFFGGAVREILEKGDQYGRSDYGKGQKALVEFVSANPTGPMHIGNARGGALGDLLASVLDFAGYKTVREFYINDAGNQIVKLSHSLEARYLQRVLGEDAAELPEDGYRGEDVIALAGRFYDRFGEQYKDCGSEERRQALVDFALPINIAGLKTDLLSYRIAYDEWFHESALHQNGEVDRVV
ncbi:MAG: arginine--tRNA ligase, partial [Oscillospiraceae bacterium]|nr:arginine--tRNA ligase [Oscillospiraceae bacterium]